MVATFLRDVFALLESIEFVEDNDLDICPSCRCGGKMNVAEERVHTADCKLAALLKQKDAVSHAMPNVRKVFRQSLDFTWKLLHNARLARAEAPDGVASIVESQLSQLIEESTRCFRLACMLHNEHNASASPLTTTWFETPQVDLGGKVPNDMIVNGDVIELMEFLRAKVATVKW